MHNYELEANDILVELAQNEQYSKYVDATLPIPMPFQGTGTIKLIVLGQDPTIKNAEGRKNIKTVLNLDKNRSVRAYLAGVCNDLGIKITENVYATNLYKNFFVKPPTQIEEVDIFKAFIGFWLPLLREEIGQYENVAVLTLGEPILAPLVMDTTSAKVRDYWGYTTDWKDKSINPFDFIKAKDNRLHRTIFPFPHQPSLRKQFYKTYLQRYTWFMKSEAFSSKEIQ